MSDDEWMDWPEPREAIAEIAAVAPAELFEYPGGGHLFTDAGSPDYDADATVLAHARILEFLAAL
ncbi:hypothetical protein [Luethyella okanaganae]|uniref:Dienelactone hydrolase family protein n=1 Tax=Luethyella okanaganae TaxID=69372 RepID=A0ABW1VI95_9MICO